MTRSLRLRQLSVAGASTIAQAFGRPVFADRKGERLSDAELLAAIGASPFEQGANLELLREASALIPWLEAQRDAGWVGLSERRRGQLNDALASFIALVERVNGEGA